MPSTYTPIQTTRVTTPVANVTFSSIPQTYTDLVCICLWRSNDVQYQNSLVLRLINSDAGNNYDYMAHSWIGGGGLNAMQGPVSFILGGSFTTNFEPTAFELDILQFNSYSNTQYWKPVLFERTGSGQLGYSGMSVGTWRNTSGITSFRVAPQAGSGNIVTGSVFTLYGIKAA